MADSGPLTTGITTGTDTPGGYDYFLQPWNQANVPYSPLQISGANPNGQPEQMFLPGFQGATGLRNWQLALVGIAVLWFFLLRRAG